MRMVLAVILLGLSACNSEPSFDERYAAAKKHVDENSRKIDAELQQRAKSATDAPASQPATLVMEDADSTI